MSLTAFLIRNPTVSRNLRLLLGPVEGEDPIMFPAAAPIGSRNPPLSGTAIDYMLRFELQRRFPQSRAEEWIAEKSEQLLRDKAGVDRVVLKSDPKPTESRSSIGLWKHAHRLVVDARRSHGRFVRLHRPTSYDFRRMARLSVLLAKLDGVYRGKSLTARESEVADEDVVEDALAMLAAVPDDGALGFPERAGIWLNPSFGPYSKLVGGADADLIVGDTIVDVKAHRNPSFDREAPQLVGYALLANGARTTERKRFPLRIPEIRKVGIYWARHGVRQAASLRFRPGDPIYQSVARGFFRSVLLETVRPIGGRSAGLRRPWYWWGGLWQARQEAGFVVEHSDPGQENRERGIPTDAEEIEASLDANPYTAREIGRSGPLNQTRRKMETGGKQRRK